MNVKPLLEFIGKPESGCDYNVVYGGIKTKHRPVKPLVTMTIGQVLDWQDRIDPLYMSEASGYYQIMEDTLRGLYASAGLTTSDLFNEENQDRLAVQLLRRRGLDDYMSGKITARKFAQNLSKEWASLPAITKDRQGRPAQGQSYYAGDGLNKSHVSIEDTIAAVQSIRPEIDNPVPRTSEAIHHDMPEEQPQGLLAKLIALIIKIFGSIK